MSSKVTITFGVNRLGQYQASISNAQHGFRFAGSEYDGRGKALLTKKLTQRDADEIRSYLDEAFPVCK